jgi:hypothetical protein
MPGGVRSRPRQNTSGNRTEGTETAYATNGEDENDWKAFRKHVIAIGAPDPGEAPIEDSPMTA